MAAAVAVLRTALTACGTGGADHGEADRSGDYEAASAGGRGGNGGLQSDDMAEEFFGAAARRTRVVSAVNAVLEHAHTLLYDLPGPHCDSETRHQIAGVAMELLELCPLISDAPADADDAAAASELPLAVQSRCDELLLRTQQLPQLPAVLQRGSEDQLRRMCIADAALVRHEAGLHGCYDL